MSVEMLPIYKYILFVSLFSTLCLNAGCASTEAERQYKGPASKVMRANFDETWRAAQKAMINYPIRVNNIDSGVLETELIRGQELWTAPHKSKKRQPGLRYTIKLLAIKGESEGAPSTAVSVHKVIRHEKDFFAGEAPEYSDGFEEEMIIYRIERELILERALEKAYKQNKI